MDIKEMLLSEKDEKYKSFQGALIPTVSSERIIGVRIPKVRQLAKRLQGTTVAEDFMNTLPHEYFDEDNLHAFLIEGIRDFDKCVSEIYRFLPYVNNWATCDSMSPAVFKRNKEKLLTHIQVWLNSEHTYTVRFAIVMLMKHFLDFDFKKEHLDSVANVRRNGYYTKMAVAWFFATALTKQYDAAIEYIEKRRLDTDTHKMAIQKACDSNCILNKRKLYLKSLK